MRIFLLALVVGGALLLLVPPAAQADVQFGPFNFPGKKRCVGVCAPIYEPHCPSGTDWHCGPPVYTPCCPTIRAPRICIPWRYRFRYKVRCRMMVRSRYGFAVRKGLDRQPRGYTASTSYPGGPQDFGGRKVVRPRRARCR